jgi:hypothetical protein
MNTTDYATIGFKDKSIYKSNHECLWKIVMIAFIIILILFISWLYFSKHMPSPISSWVHEYSNRFNLLLSLFSGIVIALVITIGGHLKDSSEKSLNIKSILMDLNNKIKGIGNIYDQMPDRINNIIDNTPECDHLRPKDYYDILDWLRILHNKIENINSTGNYFMLEKFDAKGKILKPLEKDQKMFSHIENVLEELITDMGNLYQNVTIFQEIKAQLQDKLVCISKFQDSIEEQKKLLI